MVRVRVRLKLSTLIIVRRHRACPINESEIERLDIHIGD